MATQSASSCSAPSANWHRQKAADEVALAALFDSPRGILPAVTSFDHDVDAMTQNAKERLSADLATPGLREAVALYFDPRHPFAGQMFDSLGRNPADVITSDDLLAVTLLDVRWTPLAVRRLLTDQAARISELLREISSDADLWADDCAEQLNAVNPLWDLLCDLPAADPHPPALSGPSYE